VTTKGEAAVLRQATLSFEQEDHAEYAVLSLGMAAVRERVPRHWEAMDVEKRTFMIADQIKRLQDKLLRRIRNTQLRMAE
jgi:hypothetical protein